MKSHQLTLKIPKETFEILDELRKRKGRLKIQELIREAIDEYIQREKGFVCVVGNNGE